MSTLAWRRAWLLSMLLMAASLIGGCSTMGAARSGAAIDPWENWNRKVFSFNESLDDRVLRPVATAYSNIVPHPVRLAINNFFGNFADAWSAVNNLLQWKLTPAYEDVVRVGTNSVLGLGGLIDIASEFGLDRHNEDFGQTLGTWGFGAGAYIVWPLLGPSSLRDSFALPLDLSVSPAWLIDDGAVKFEIVSLQFVNKRAGLLGATNLLNDIALDKYTFVRDAYLQRRHSLIHDSDDAPSEDDTEAPAKTKKQQ